MNSRQAFPQHHQTTSRDIHQQRVNERLWTMVLSHPSLPIVMEASSAGTLLNYITPTMMPDPCSRQVCHMLCSAQDRRRHSGPCLTTRTRRRAPLGTTTEHAGTRLRLMTHAGRRQACTTLRILACQNQSMLTLSRLHRPQYFASAPCTCHWSCQCPHS